MMPLRAIRIPSMILRLTALWKNLSGQSGFQLGMPHDKTNKMACAPSEDSDLSGHPPSLISVFAVRMKKLGSLATHWAHSEDSVQTGRMPRMIWVFAGRRVILLVLSWGGSNDHSITIFLVYLRQFPSFFCFISFSDVCYLSGEGCTYQHRSFKHALIGCRSLVNREC